MRRSIPDDLADAQHRYMALTGVQISQTEVQRLAAALHGGQSVHDAVAAVYAFFSTPIDWEAERRAFADWVAERRRGSIDAIVLISTDTDRECMRCSTGPATERYTVPPKRA